MKKIAQVAVIGALIGLGATAVNAQTTNADLAVNISLSGTAQTGSGLTRVKMTTKDVMNALNTILGASFTSRDRLLLRFPTTGSDSPVFVVRSGTGSSATETVVDTGVLSVEVAPSPFGATVTGTTDHGSFTAETTVAIVRFTFNSGASPSFMVQGYTTSTQDNKGLRGEVTDNPTPTRASGSVSGTGTTAAGDAAVLQGTISISGRKIEPSV